MLDRLLLLAFGAGVLGFFAPCSIAMLPAYVSYFLGQGARNELPVAPSGFRQSFGGLGILVAAAGLGVSLWGLGELQSINTGQARVGFDQLVAMALGAVLIVSGFLLTSPGTGVLGGLQFGLVTTGGILATYLVLGMIVVSALQVIPFKAVSYAVLGIGALLIILGILGFFGRGLSFALPVHAPRRRTMAGFFVFGVAYGIVSLGCNLAILGIPIFTAWATAGPAAGAASFLAYGAGAGLLMIIVSVSVASSHGLTGKRIRRIMPWIRPVQNAVFIAAGAYVIWYDWVNVIAPAR